MLSFKMKKTRIKIFFPSLVVPSCSFQLGQENCKSKDKEFVGPVRKGCADIVSLLSRESATHVGFKGFFTQVKEIYSLLKQSFQGSSTQYQEIPHSSQGGILMKKPLGIHHS